MWNTALAPASIMINNGIVFSSFCFLGLFVLPFVTKVFSISFSYAVADYGRPMRETMESVYRGKLCEVTNLCLPLRLRGPPRSAGLLRSPTSNYLPAYPVPIKNAVIIDTASESWDSRPSSINQAVTTFRPSGVVTSAL